MIAVIRPTGWDLQLFLHVLGATTLFGATGAVALLGWAGRTRADRTALARGTLGTLLLLALPGWIATVAFGSWLKSKEHLGNGIRWVDLGYDAITAGLVLLPVAGGIAFAWMRRPGARWQPTAVAVLASVYVVVLGVAWWAMSAKVPT